MVRYRPFRGFAGAALALAAVSLVGCSPTAPSVAKVGLHSARTLSEFVNQIKTEYNYTLTDAELYDHTFADIPGALSQFRSDDPVQGSYAAQQTATFPTSDGFLVFGPKDPNRRTSFSCTNLSTRPQCDGEFQAFWGIRDFSPRTASTVSFARIVVVIEGIVSWDGAQKYRSLKSMYGQIINEPFLLGAFPINPAPVAIVGAFEEVNIETIDKNDPRVPNRFGAGRVAYNAIWTRR